MGRHRWNRFKFRPDYFEGHPDYKPRRLRSDAQLRTNIPGTRHMVTYTARQIQQRTFDEHKRGEASSLSPRPPMTPPIQADFDEAANPSGMNWDDERHSEYGGGYERDFNPAPYFPDRTSHMPKLVGPKTETDEFLQKARPSANNTTGFPWYWVCIPRNKDDKEDALKPAEEQSFESRVDFMEQGQVLVDKLTKDCKHIAETAPVRGNKKTGAKSQKELREIEHAKFNDQVAALAKKYNVLTGKWLLYLTADNVDAIWAKVVNAIAKPDGALAKTGVVHTAKVSTHAEEGQGYVICIYCDDSWDRDGVGKAFKCLVRELGLVSSAYKSDANTLLGIDSKHSSGIRSSLYGKTDFMTKDEIEQAIEKRKAELEAPVKVPKKLKKEEEEDGFVTDEDSDEEAPKAKKQKV